MKQDELFKIEHAILSLGSVADFEIAYTLQKNLSKITPILMELRQSIKDVLDFNEKIEKLSKEDVGKFLSDPVNLKNKQSLEKKLKDFNQAVTSQEVTIEFNTIKLSFIRGLDPLIKNKFTQSILNSLMGIILIDDLN